MTGITRSDLRSPPNPSTPRVGGLTQGVLSPDTQRHLENALSALDAAVRSGLLQPQLEKTLKDEHGRLFQLLLAAAQAGGQGRVLSAEVRDAVKTRVDEISGLLLLVLLDEAGEKAFLQERRLLEAVLRADDGSPAGPLTATQQGQSIDSSQF